MILYLVVICLYSFLVYLSEKARENGYYFLQYMWLLVALLSISVFAGIRNVQVGIDISTYGKNIFEATVSFGPKEAMLLYNRWGDIGYVYFNYLVSFFSANINVYLGVLEFVIQFSFLLFFRKFREESSPALSTLLFNFATLPLTFSMLRQSFAMAIAIWIIYFLIKNKVFKAALIGFVSIFFHKSSVIFITIVFFVYIYSKIKEKIKEKKLVYFVFFVTAIISLLLIRFPEVVYLFIPNEGLSNIQQGNMGSFARLLLMFLPIIYFKLSNKEHFIRNNTDYFLYCICLLTIAFSWLSGINYSITRFTNYLYPVYMLFIAKQARISGRIKVLIGLFIWGIIICWWLLARGNEGGVFPYTTYWQQFVPKEGIQK
ncbi:EpsG family protein [Enterococcus avium]|jgi:hypothetical protein|uniref:EpsG family protein n=1 Tax=Enterococcus avium TaxID=33945 RepID=UPI0028928A48|nr:EpsG family protein [Enterococcus avium]MDT2472015.1 EpsG family protein [Enterococcus avium]